MSPAIKSWPPFYPKLLQKLPLIPSRLKEPKHARIKISNLFGAEDLIEFFASSNINSGLLKRMAPRSQMFRFIR
jgi:hypothetical protein